MPDRLKALLERPLIVALLIGLAAQLLFTVNIQNPAKLNFDETHYVPAARALIALDAPRNIEHPLVGKELIASGILMFGDNVYGWRLVPSLFGSLTVVGGFLFLFLLMGGIRPAAVGAVLLLLNQMLFVQARIAMLDIFLCAFMIWAMAAFLWSARAETARRAWTGWLAGSVLLGLAVGCKWAAIPYVAMAGMAFIVLRIRDARLAGRPIAHALTGRDQPHWTGIATVPGLLAMGVVSIAVYLVTFAPAFFYALDPLTLGKLIPFQSVMYEQQTQILPHHNYQSNWWQWPLMLRPIWYFYEAIDGVQRGVLLIGNPAIMWGGLGAIFICVMAGIENRAIRPLGVALLWIASIAIYIVIPKSLGFYYYYQLSGIFICFAVPVAARELDPGGEKALDIWFAAAAFILFVYFYPIISAQPLDGTMAFEKWMWLFSWR